MKLDPQRVVLCLAACILLGGYLAVYRPLEARIAAQYAQIDDGRLLLANELAIAHRESSLRDEKRSLEKWLERVGTRQARTELVNRFLQNVAIASESHHVHITSVGVDAPLANPAGNASTTLFDELPMTVSARGSYYGLLNVVADLDRAALPMRITLDTIANPRRDVVPDPELQATFHVTLFREADIRPETAHAPA